MELNVLKANEGLAESVSNLQAQVAQMQKMLDLCLQMLSEFGHFVPSIIEDFKYEMRKLDAEGAVVGECKDVQSEEELTIYANLKKDGISASDDLVLLVNKGKGDGGAS